MHFPSLQVVPTGQRTAVQLDTQFPPIQIVLAGQRINAQDEPGTHFPLLQTNPCLYGGQIGLKIGTHMLFTHLKPGAQRGSEVQRQGACTHTHMVADISLHLEP